MKKSFKEIRDEILKKKKEKAEAANVEKNTQGWVRPSNDEETLVRIVNPHLWTEQELIAIVSAAIVWQKNTKTLIDEFELYGMSLFKISRPSVGAQTTIEKIGILPKLSSEKQDGLANEQLASQQNVKHGKEATEDPKIKCDEFTSTYDVINFVKEQPEKGKRKKKVETSTTEKKSSKVGKKTKK